MTVEQLARTTDAPADDARRADAAATWEGFCDRLKAAGKLVLNADVAGTAIDQAEGYRYLTRLLRIALDMHVENADTDFPGFYQASHPTAKIGADNPDNIYWNANISGARRYRITGTRGSVPILSFGTKANRYAIDGTMASTGELNGDELKVGPDGRFEIIVSKTREGENWLPLSDDSSMLLVRQTFVDRATEEPVTVKIEAIDPPRPTPAPLTIETLQQGLDRTMGFVEGTAKTFLLWTDQFRDEQFNQIATVDQSMFFKGGGDPTIFYLHGYWSLSPGEALVIESRVPECDFWNFQLDNVWMESLDYRHHQVHVNNGSARLNDDGSLTIVVAERDPGYGNWMDSAGHSQGTMLLRWTGAKDHPVPTAKVVKLG